ncbi:energy-coupling factor ABC transporter permease [Solirubrobacter sp. CPCC 204708]|uniref:Energy-coupling factor ABC transporter permease n=1 Tax=Solirubrobacter deserti TaxID=2282478 RepID=A0ABT4RE30_9ACTN|nr:energy-coupling factor ABC transporter permease [Solirubrobacter deserti]MBE2316025.1 energy-coupling factor ABC transporter permease [Solirubrobacter deserti]MDA0136777.1 energy-coupling factor ABC transporter permease [Solirubrobacter deserti]
MHIPEGFLTGEAAAVGAVTAALGVGICLRGARRHARERDLPIAGLAAAFFVVGEAPFIPVTIGTNAHLLGGALAVALLGPYLGALTITTVCLIQALVFGSGGITTLGATITVLALVPAFVGYPALLALRKPLPLPVAGGITAGLCVLLSAAVFVAFMTLGADSGIDRGTFAGVTFGAYAVVALIEGVITALLLRALLSLRPDLVRARRRPVPA